MLLCPGGSAYGQNMVGNFRNETVPLHEESYFHSLKKERASVLLGVYKTHDGRTHINLRTLLLAFWCVVGDKYFHVDQRMSSIIFPRESRPLPCGQDKLGIVYRSHAISFSTYRK